jgi:hypothetical protein
VNLVLSTMNKIGFLVVNQRTGNIAEGRDHAAKIFESIQTARAGCKPLSADQPVPITYASLVQSLLQGTPFCFDTDDAYARFVKAVRNDPANRPFLEYSRDRTFIRWRHSNAKSQPKPDSDTSVATGVGA